MRCNVCRTKLTPRGKRAHRYADATGRIYKTIHATVYRARG